MPTTRKFAGTAGYNSTKQAQVIVQYAPGTQVNCTGCSALWIAWSTTL